MNWIELGVFLAIVGFLISGGLTFIKAIFGPVEKALEEAAGTAEAIFGMLDDQTKTCKKNGFFAFWKGCIVGVGVLGYLAAQFGAWFVGAFPGLFRRKGKGVPVGADPDTNGYKALQEARKFGVPEKDIRDKIIDDGNNALEVLEAKGYSRETDKAMFDAVLGACATESSCGLLEEAAKSIPDVTQRQAAEKAAAQNRAQAMKSYEDAKEGKTEEEKQAMDEAAKAGGLPI